MITERFRPPLPLSLPQAALQGSPLDLSEMPIPGLLHGKGLSGPDDR